MRKVQVDGTQLLIPLHVYILPYFNWSKMITVLGSLQCSGQNFSHFLMFLLFEPKCAHICSRGSSRPVRLSWRAFFDQWLYTSLMEVQLTFDFNV